MTHTQSDPEPALDPQLWAVGQALRASQRVEQVRGQLKAAQRSAADSFDRSADSQDRVARVYDEAAEQREPDDPEEYREHAARHREFAYEDRRLAQQLRQMAGRNDG